MFDAGPLFHEIVKAPNGIVVLQGGTDSGKTVAAIQFCVYAAKLPLPPDPLDPPVITVLSESIPNSKKGAYRVWELLYSSNEHVRRSVVHWDRGGRVIKFRSGWILEFVGVTDEQNAKQGKRQYLFVNEANGVPWMVFWQMAKKTRIKTVIDYNPTSPFWAHDKLIPYPDGNNDLNKRVTLIISDHRHNPFLPEEQHGQTENIKDPELFRVYARGLTGKNSGIIYTTWTMIAEKDFPFDRPKFAAIDFGYTNDPTAIVDLRVIGRSAPYKLYVHELAYTPGISNRLVKKILRDRGHKSSSPLYCEKDLATIREFRLKNIMAIPAMKGDPVVGINRLKTEFEVFYTHSSKNLQEELRRYTWLLDPDTNLPTNEPKDKYNHLMDAIRYGAITHVSRAR